MRKLATVQTIKALHPIEGADQIEVAEVLGWKVVVKKDQFTVGSECIYVEIDSVLPDKPEFEFLRARKFKIKTIKLRQQISQGICFPLSILPSILPNNMLPETKYEVGQDVTDLLGITQWIPAIPANIAGTVKGPFPSFMPKTDETRVQVLQPILDKYQGTECYVAEKVDGCSVTCYLKDGEFGVCSRNLELKETEENLLWKKARELKIEEALRKAKEDRGSNYAVQCEIIGQGIQKNNLKILGNKLLAFNVFNIDKYEYLDYELFLDFCDEYGIETVPIVDDTYVLESEVDKLVELSKGFSHLNPKVYREGIVIRPLKEKIDLQMSNDWGNGRVTFKVVNPLYLLKYDE